MTRAVPSKQWYDDVIKEIEQARAKAIVAGAAGSAVLVKKTWRRDPGMQTTRERLARAVRAALAFGPVHVEDVKALKARRL